MRVNRLQGRWSRPALLCAALCGLLAAVGCGGSSSSSQNGASGGGEHVVLDYLHWGTLGDADGKFTQQFADAVAKRTHGDVEIRVHPAGELPYQSTQALSAVGSGGVQMAAAYSGFVAGESKMAALPQLPFLIDSTPELAKVFPAYEPYLTKELDSKFHASLLFWYPVPVLTSFGKGTPIQSLSDFKGRKIRATSPDQVAFLKKVGADPTNLESEELAPALQTNVVNGFLASALFTVGNQLSDRIDWTYNQPINAGPVYVIISNDALNKLSATDRDALQAVGAEFQKRIIKETPKLNADAVAQIKAAGATVVPGSDAAAAEGARLMSPYWQQFTAGDQQLSAALAKVRDETGK